MSEEVDLRDFPRDAQFNSGKFANTPYTVQSKDQTWSFGSDVKLTLGAQATFSVQVLNDSAAKDDDGVYPDVVPFAATSPLLKIKATGKPSAATTVDISSLALALKATGDVSFIEYRRHEETEVGSKALVADLTPPRTILRNSDVLALKNGEALSMQVEGDFTAALSFTWSDVITSGASELAMLAGSAITVAFKIKPRLTLQVPVALSDSLVVTASRNSDGQIRIAVRKDASRSHGFKVTAGASVGTSFNGIDEAVTAVSDGFLAAHVPEATVKSLESKIKSTLENLAKQKAEIAFTYEYKRTAENAALVDVVVPNDADVDDVRSQAVRGNIERLVEMLTVGPANVKLVNFLDEQIITLGSSIGFSFSFFKWFSSSESTATTLTRTDRHDFGKQAVMRAYKGIRKFTQSLPDFAQNVTDFTWAVDFKADMSAYREQPATGDFSFGLQYLVPQAEDVDARSTPFYADFASMWRIGSGNADIVARLAQVQGASHVSMQLQFDDAVLRKITGRVAKNDFGGWGDAFGAAMPFVAHRVPLRDFTRRRAAFGPLWTSFFANGGLQGDALRNLVGRAFGDGEFMSLRGPEAAGAFGSFINTVTVQYKDVVANRQRFENGLLALQQCFGDPSTPDGKIVEAFDHLKAFWTQRPYLIASAVYLLTKAEEAGVLDQVKRAMSLTLEDGTIVMIA